MPDTMEHEIDSPDVLNKMFGGRYRGREAQAAALVAYNDAMNKCYAEADGGEISFSYSKDNPTGNTIRKGAMANPKAMLAKLDNISKGLGDSQPDLLQELQAHRASLVASISKDWTPTNPVGGTGLTAYDLEPQAKVLVPLHTPLINSLPREKGVGQTRKFKRIDSFSNAGIPGGSGNLSIGFSSLTTTTTFGPTGNVTLARPQKIAYTGSDWSVNYIEMGLSDSVDFITQFQGLGFDDVRGLSHTALLYAHKMGEERLALYGRGTSAGNAGYQGSVSAPSGITGSTATTGGTIPDAAGYFAYITANTGAAGMGQESSPSTVFNTAATTGGGLSTLTFTVGTEPQGGITYNLYLGTTTGIANSHFQGTFVGNTFTLTSYNSTSAANPNTDTSFSATQFDGFLTIASTASLTGYFKRVNASLSTSSPGTEFDQALATMFTNNGADPDEIWMDGNTRAQLQRSLRIGGTNGAASGYRTSIMMADGNTVIGSSVSGIMNSNTSKVLDVRTHRFMPSGAALIRSTSLPIENTRITAPSKMVLVQEYMAIDWPNIQLTYDQSTYEIGTLVHEAPAWGGLLVGIKSNP